MFKKREKTEEVEKRKDGRKEGRNIGEKEIRRGRKKNKNR